MRAVALRWVRRLVASALAATLIVVVADALEYDPEPVRVALLCLVLVAGLGLLLDGLPGGDPDWYPAPTHPPVHAGRDTLTQSHVRLLEDHQRSRHPDALLRERLLVLAERALLARHGVGARSERGRELLGPELVEVLHGPVVRLHPRRIDTLLRQIEDL